MPDIRSQICLARFKVDQFAVVLPECLHMCVPSPASSLPCRRADQSTPPPSFHEHCIRSWFRLSRVCPVCRAPTFPDPKPQGDLLQ